MLRVDDDEEGNPPKADSQTRPGFENQYAVQVHQKMTNEDSRKHERKPAVLTIDWRVIGSEDIIWSWTDDISVGGLKVRTMTPPEEGTTLMVSIEHARGGETKEHLSIPARVAWVRLDDEFCGMGLAFQPEEESDRKRLQLLLDEMENRKSDA